MKFTAFDTFGEVIDYVETALGEYANEHDVEAIADEVCEWTEIHRGVYKITQDGPDFWKAVERHAYPENTIVTHYGNRYDFDLAVSLMDDDVREEVHADYAPCTNQEFFDAYCEYHKKAFKETFVLDTENPQV